MKQKLLSLLALLMIGISGVWAETTVIARMQDLVDAASENTATVSTDYTTDVVNGGVYDFANQGFIKGIANEDVMAALGTKYVTVAAWVYGRPTGGCIFSYGGQSNGIKFKLTGTTMQTTTKGKADYQTQSVDAIAANQWNLVAFTINPAFSSTRYISGHQGNFNYFYTKNATAGMNTPAETDQLFAIGSGNQGNAREEFTGTIANLTIITSDGWLGASDLVADLVGAAPTYNNLDAWKAGITATENLVGGYTTEQIASLSSVTSASQIDTWLANNSKIAFDENKYYRVWNKSRSEVTKAAWDLHENSVAWAEYDGESKNQIWQFKNTGATNEYKYKIQNIGNPGAFMPSSLGGNTFHAYVDETNAGVFAITDAGSAQFQVHAGTGWGSYVFADGNNHLDGWIGDGKDLWYLEIAEIDDVLTTITWNVVDADHNVLATQTMENCAEGSEYTTTLSYAYTTLNGNTTVTATKENQVIELTYAVGQLPFTSSTNFATATWYKMKNATRGNSAYYDENEENIRVASREDNDWSNLWAFIGNPINGYQIVNKAAGEGLFLNAASAANGAKMTMNATATTFTLVEGNEAKAGVANTIGFKLGSVYVNDYANAGFLSFWQDSPVADQGSNWVLEEVTIKDWAAFETLVNQLQPITFGSGLGEYTLGNPVMDAYALAYIAEFVSYLDDKENVEQEDYEYAMESMQMMLDNMTLNLPKAGMFVTIKGKTSGKYIHNDGTTGAMITLGENNDETAIYYVAEGKKLVNYSNGLYMAAATQVTVGGAADTYTFSEGDAKGNYYIKPSSKNYLIDWTDGRANYWSTPATAGGRCNWVIEEVTEIPVILSTIDGHNYGTFYTPVAISDLDGVKAYIATEEDGKAKMTPIETIPANTAVVLYAKDAAKTGATFTIGEADADTDDNILAGQAATIAKVEGACTLQNNAESGLGFYSYTGAALKGFKAYLNASVHNVKSFTLDFDMETAIRGIQEAEEKSAAMYDMSGRRIVKAQKGVYIQNGKKYVK